MALPGWLSRASVAELSSSSKAKKRGMSAKEQAFVEHYTGDAKFNGAEACRLAGYAEGSARQQASRMLTKDYIQEAIKQRISEIAMSSHEVLVRLSEHARGSMEDFIDVATMTVDFQKAAEKKQLHLLKKVKVVSRTENPRDKDREEITRIDTVEFELYDQQAALALLGKHHKLFVERTELTGKDGKAIPISVQPFSDMDDDELDQFIQENGG